MAQIEIDIDIYEKKAILTAFVKNDANKTKLWLEKEINFSVNLNFDNEELISFVVNHIDDENRKAIPESSVNGSRILFYPMVNSKSKAHYRLSIGLDENEALTVVDNLIRHNFNLKTVY